MNSVVHYSSSVPRCSVRPRWNPWMETTLAMSEAKEDPWHAEVMTLHFAEINLALFNAYLADLPDCENECFLCTWLIFACICSLI